MSAVTSDCDDPLRKKSASYIQKVARLVLTTVLIGASVCALYVGYLINSGRPLPLRGKGDLRNRVRVVFKCQKSGRKARPLPWKGQYPTYPELLNYLGHPDGIIHHDKHEQDLLYRFKDGTVYVRVTLNESNARVDLPKTY